MVTIDPSGIAVGPLAFVGTTRVGLLVGDGVRVAVGVVARVAVAVFFDASESVLESDLGVEVGVAVAVGCGVGVWVGAASAVAS